MPCMVVVRRAACPHSNSYGLKFSFGIDLLFSNVSGLLSMCCLVCVLATELRSCRFADHAPLLCWQFPVSISYMAGIVSCRAESIQSPQQFVEVARLYRLTYT